MFWKVASISLLVLCCNTVSYAAWREASSDHFLIYTDDSEAEIRRFTEKLERYRNAMSFVFPTDAEKPSPSNRVTIYVVSSKSLVRELYGDAKNSRYIAGFYRPQAGGSLAIIPPVNSSLNGKPTESELTLLHEYAHHYLLESASYIIPRWFGEGFAEYFSSAKFDKDGTVGLGLPSVMRLTEIQTALDVSLEEVFDNKAYAARKLKRYNNFYGRSWLLFHYMYSDNDRRRSLLDYLGRLNKGEGELSSAISTFGPLEDLKSALSSYQRQPKWVYLRIPPEKTTPGNITIRELNKAEAAIMPIRIRSKAGVDEKEAAEVVVDAREVATQYPDEPEVQAELAEAEFDSGNNEAAIIAADRALALNPVHINALIQKGYALARIAKNSQDTEAWTEVRKHFVSINKIENNHPVPLIHYYLSYVEQNAEPPEISVRGLERALDLAPYDGSLRMITAERQMQEKRFKDAIATLNTLAYSPHAEEDNPALKLLEQAKKELTGTASEGADK